ncbi:DsrE family protein [Clostridium sp. 19966]|uniref:DsrE family protein n=1 Tax=Clostridium sp. 19966 TaxID=2768166 RepID=UPI0028DF7B77|nr:DsrE family protein [Clostridium sp. 19966]MDT8715241.1 DsrE family protein [Clostridium sp. 19966]
MDEIKAIFHVDELHKWGIVLKNVSNLLNAVDIEKVDIEVLANGEAVKGCILDSDKKILASMQELSEKGVKFVACNNALNSNNIKKEELMKFIDIVPAGALELVIKQNQGYAYIKP